MRLKVLLALGVLLVAFAINATFMMLSIHRARQGVVANEAYLQLQGSVDAAWKSLNDFAPALGRGTAARLDPNLPLALRMGRQHLDDALGVIDHYLEKEPKSPRRPDFENRRRQIATLGAQLDAVSSELATAAVAVDSKARPEFESHFAALTHSLNRMRRPLRGESGQIAQRLSDDEETALATALALGAAGLAVAGAAFLFTLRTLRPLSVLRGHARRLGGGDYSQRTGVRSNDEIGDLAREFDAMADAIQEREHRLIRSERLATVGRMAAHIAHEVRNPLASIGLNAELLGDEIVDRGEEARRLVTSIIGEVDRLTEITETYLRFARLPRPKLERESIGAIVTSVVEMSRGELAQAGVELGVDIAPGLPDIGADEAQLRQALINLIRNAREALSGSTVRKLEISVREVAGRIAIAVHDTGPGIAAANLAKIFDPFFSTKDRGTGLGLALVQQIVVDHGGQIEVASAPGAGTTFTITLPVGDSDRSKSVTAGGGAGGAVGGGAASIPERVVKAGELEVQLGGGGRAEDQGALEGGRAGGGLARGG
ncbi:MAG TPA: ATP-binding protein [Polyangia bacterium]|nr:ATP-binding protein [Polyangia bacterium]